MGETTKIEWTSIPGYIGGTWNPWQGCTKVSPGCKFCYMYREKEHYGQDPAVVVRSKPQTFNLPLRVKEPHAWFTSSWTDFFHETADKWRPEAWEIIHQTPQHLYLILTKRPDNIYMHLPDDWFPRNVWWGVSIENQDYLNRWDILDSVLHYHHPPVMFVSAEPLLGPLDLSSILEEIDCGDEEHEWWTRAPDWVIGGGESGTNARPCAPAWARSLRDQCVEAEVPFFWKQWGQWGPGYDLDKELKGKIVKGQFPEHIFDIGGRCEWVFSIGKKDADCLIDGREWREFPGDDR